MSGSWCSNRPSNWRGSTSYCLRASLSMTVTRTCASRIRSRSSEARYHWIFSPLKVRMPSSSGLILSSVPLLGKQDAPRTHVIARIALAHGHLVGALVRCRWRSSSSVSPTVQKTEQSDAELSLQSRRRCRQLSAAA